MNIDPKMTYISVPQRAKNVSLLLVGNGSSQVLKGPGVEVTVRTKLSTVVNQDIKQTEKRQYT